jgi:hypothetical protein
MAGFVADLEASVRPESQRGQAQAEPEWRIVPRGSVVDTGLRPLWAEGAADPCDGVLVACGPTVALPYRELRAETPVALVPLELRGVRQAAGRRAAAALLLLMGLGWAAIAMLA